MQSVVVTGASGFLGSRLIARLGASHRVFALVRNEHVALPTGVDRIVADLSKPLDRSVLPPRVDSIIHLAQSRRYREFPEGASDTFQVNVRATFDLLEYAREAGAARFVLASSGGIYGSSPERLVETDRARPLDFYLSSKYVGELLLANYSPYFACVILRPFFVYGAGQREMLVPRLLGRIQRGETITIDGDPGLSINPIHVDDAVRAFAAALQLRRSEVVNVAGDDVVSITELVRLLEKCAGKAATIVHSLGTGPRDLVGDNRRMKDVLNVRPSISLQDGIRDLVNNHGP